MDDDALYLEAKLEEAEQESKRLADILVAILKRGELPTNLRPTFTAAELADDDGRKLMTTYRGDGTVTVSLHRWHNEPASATGAVTPSGVLAEGAVPTIGGETPEGDK